MAITQVDNVLQAVQTYQKSGLGRMWNSNVALRLANTKFKNFQKLPQQLGSTVLFDTPSLSRSTIVKTSITNANPEIDIAFQATTSQVESLTINRYAYNSKAFNDQEYVMNAANRIDEFHSSVLADMGTSIEQQMWEDSILDNTFTAYVPGITNNKIDDSLSFQKLAESIAEYKNIGAATGNIKYVLPDMAVPNIIGSGLTQFVPKRNDEIANSWSIGGFAGADFYTTNCLPIHISGTTGDNGSNITIVSISTDGTSITATTGANETVVVNDIVQFNDDVAGQPNLRTVTRVGHLVSANVVQRRVTSNAAADGAGNITFTIDPPLVSDQTSAEQNISNPVAAGMVLTTIPSHRAGVMIGGDSFFVGMPALNDKSPFKTAWEYDDESQISLRVYYGSSLTQPVTGFIADAIFGSMMVKWLVRRVCLPLTV